MVTNMCMCCSSVLTLCRTSYIGKKHHMEGLITSLIEDDISLLLRILIMLFYFVQRNISMTATLI